MQPTGKSFLLVLGSIVLGCLISCSGGTATYGGSSNNNSTGTVTLTMTDAASDDIESFVVDVTQLRLRKASGAVVNVISSPVTVDLATLTDTTQLMNAISVPAGLYTSASITFDFTHASCALVGHATPAVIQDDSGAPVSGTLTLPMQFGQNAFQVAAGKHRLLEFDFDLNQSLDVDTLANTVAFEPSVLVHMDGSGKKVLTFGELIGVNLSVAEFTANVKTLQGVTLSHASYETAANTIFQIDGVPAVGLAGLAMLATKPAGTWIQVRGTVDPHSPHIVPKVVEVGTGTYNGGTDMVEGNIIDRIGNPAAGANVTLLVRGHSADSTHTQFQFDRTFTVLTSFANTKVIRRDSAQSFDTDALNVGQRVRAFGMLTGLTMVATAATSVVRQQPTRLFGHANGAIAGGTLHMSLERVDTRPESLFVWADSGATPPAPSNFRIDVGNLGVGLGVANGSALEARGFLSAIDDGAADCTAVSLANLDIAVSMLFVRNLAGGFSVGATASAAQIEIDISGVAGAGERALVDRGFAGVTALPTTPPPTVAPAAQVGIYEVRDKLTGVVTVHFAFDQFTSELGMKLAQGATIKTFGAIGTYDEPTNAMLASVVSVVVQ